MGRNPQLEGEVKAQTLTKLAGSRKQRAGGDVYIILSQPLIEAYAVHRCWQFHP